MADPINQKYLSYSAILILAANTMNGPGLTTLPVVASNAGILLYVALICLSVSMTSFVCRRMVYAMWSSLRDAPRNDEEEGLLEGEAATVYGGIHKPLGIADECVANDDIIDNEADGLATTTIAGEDGGATGEGTSIGIVDELIPEATNISDGDVFLLQTGRNQSQLIHHHHPHQDDDDPSSTLEIEKNTQLEMEMPTKEQEMESLLDNNTNNNNNNNNYDQDPTSSSSSIMIHKQPILERTSIVGQSRESYGPTTSTYVAMTMVASALCLALAQMMLCAAIMDGMFVALGGKSCALGLPSESSPLSFIHCTDHLSMKPFMNSGAPVSILSIGWLVAAAITVALGTVDLDEMMGAQYALFGCLLVSCARFAYVLRRMGNDVDVGLVVGEEDDDIIVGGGIEGEDSNNGEGELYNDDINALSWFVGPYPFQSVGPIMFNFAFVVTAPPLSAMAKKESIAHQALAMACVVMGVLYGCMGYVGAPVANAVKNGLIEGGDDTNLLSLILLGSGSGDSASILDLICIASFGLSQLAAVPVYCLLAQETLINDAGMPRFPAFMLSNVLPWILVALTYNAKFFEAFVNWSGLLILGYANFSLPLMLDMRLKKVRAFRALSHKKSYISRGGNEGRALKITSAVFSMVTASISAVIAMSVTGSLMLSGIFFVLMLVLTQSWPSASLI